jgi:hypothetical protein
MNHDNGASRINDKSYPVSHKELADSMLDAVAEAASLSVPRGYKFPPCAPSMRPTDRPVAISDRPPGQRSSLDRMVALLQEQILDQRPTLPTGIPMSVFVETHLAPAHAAPAPVSVAPPALPDEMFMGERAALLECSGWLETDSRTHSKRMIWTTAGFIVAAVMAFTLMVTGGPAPSGEAAAPSDADVVAQ